MYNIWWYNTYHIYIFIDTYFDLQVAITSMDPPLHWDPRLLQARAVNGSFFVNVADGITDRVEEVNKSCAATFKAGKLSSDICLTVLVAMQQFLLRCHHEKSTMSSRERQVRYPHFFCIAGRSLVGNWFDCCYQKHVIATLKSPIWSSLCFGARRLERRAWPWAGEATGDARQRREPQIFTNFVCQSGEQLSWFRWSW